jgi:molybdenum cofactor cytidylyltransferase
VIRAAAVILAAGAGRRLGGLAKAALLLPDGRSFLQAIVECARGGGCEEIVVVVGPPHEEETAALALRLGLTVARNPKPEVGMVSSLAIGLELLGSGSNDPVPETTVALAWPVDHPRISPETIRTLLEHASLSRITVPTHSGRGGHPTAFGRDLWPALMALPPGGARAVAASQPDLVDRIPVDDQGVVIDVDTPGDYDKIK